MDRGDTSGLKTPEEGPFTNKDRRMFHRFALHGIKVRFLKLVTHQDLADGSPELSGVCWNIGAGGAVISCSGEVAVGAAIEMWFDLVDGFEPLHILGRVVWGSPAASSGWRMGVSFEKVRLMGLTRILKIRAKLSSHT